MNTDTPLRPYKDGHEHLEDELKLVDLLLRLRIRAQSLQNQIAPEIQTSRAVYIAPSEVEWLLDESSLPQSEGVSSTAARAEIAQLRTNIDGRIARSREERIFLGLVHLCDLFRLSAFERDAVVICLAPELRRKYDRLYAYIQDDITRKRPSVDLVLELLCETEAERWNSRRLLADSAPLMRSGLIQKMDDPHSPSGSSGLAQFLKLDPRICEFLLGNHQIDLRLAGEVELILPTEAAVLPIDGSIVAGASRFLAHHLGPENHDGLKLVLHLHGPHGVGKRELALRLAYELNCSLLCMDAELLLAKGAQSEGLLRLAFREALLQRAILFLENTDLLSQESARPFFRSLQVTIAEFGWLVFLSAHGPWTVHAGFPNCVLHSIKVPTPEVPIREAVWESILRDENVETTTWSKQLAAQYRLTPGQIRAAVEFERNQRHMESGRSSPTFEGLASACRMQSNGKLRELAAKIEPHCSWEDLVLLPHKLAHLKEICVQYRNRYKVFETWGLGKKLGRGKGLSALFTGPSGTGKTMAAEVLARDLGLDLYKVDLASVVSKYIGETEKNLSKVFSEAETSNAILFFDEADALFGKRTKLTDAHDRYANIETSYLLQKMEEYDGVVILATNLSENMDEAFTRRIRFIIEFPFPDEAHRLRIWKSHIPTEAPVGAEVDFAHLAKEFSLTGGNIRNIALNAAFMAAGDGGEISLRHILQGTKREYEKLGRKWRDKEAGTQRGAN